MDRVRLPPIRKGYDYGLSIEFADEFLAAGETLRGELRTSPPSPARATFNVTREGDSVLLSLSGAQTAGLDVRLHLLDLTLVHSGGAVTPLVDYRFEIPVQLHVTRASA